MAAKTDRPTYTLALAASQAVASWTGLPIHREYVQEQNNRLVATAAEANLCQYADHVNTAAVAVIEWIQAKHNLARKKVLALDVDKAVALLATSGNKNATTTRKRRGRPKGSYEQQQVAYSIDFRSVQWFGEEYCFTPNQAAVVKVLFEHWERGVPDVGNETLLMAIDREAPPDRLNMVFRGHPGWGKLIVTGGTKGTHRLSDGENKVF